jgi:ABC-type branched-subunit amino acid transport system permease subunit
MELYCINLKQVVDAKNLSLYDNSMALIYSVVVGGEGSPIGTLKPPSFIVKL